MAYFLLHLAFLHTFWQVNLNRFTVNGPKQCETQLISKRLPRPLAATALAAGQKKKSKRKRERRTLQSFLAAVCLKFLFF